jgi:copper(I)-binding protein
MKMKRWLSVVLGIAALAACQQEGHQVAAGEIEVVLPWSREIPPDAPVAAGYMSIRNHGSRDDRLVAARSDAAARVEIHEIRHEDGMARMRELAGGLPLPAGGTVELKPGGYHLMFISPGRGFVADNRIRATLVFAGAGEIDVELEVRARDAVSQQPSRSHP